MLKVNGGPVTLKRTSDIALYLSAGLFSLVCFLLLMSVICVSLSGSTSRLVASVDIMKRLLLLAPICTLPLVSVLFLRERFRRKRE